MTTHSRIATLAMATVLIGTLTGCATVTQQSLSGDPQESPSTQTPDVALYEVKAGDLLGDIARRITGSVDNWQAIAEYNNIDDPRTLAVGDIVLIPMQLMQGNLPIGDTVEEDTDTTPSRVRSRIRPPIPVTTGSGVSVAVPQRSADAQTVAITVSTVEVNRTFDLKPIEQTFDVVSNAQRYASEAPQVRVSGTYYPKGVYDEPANYARLIQRAAPGTLFTLDRKVNDWYKVVTDSGVGYIREIDGTLVD